jgi:hypothetical protein
MLQLTSKSWEEICAFHFPTELARPWELQTECPGSRFMGKKASAMASWGINVKSSVRTVSHS